jgi:ketosteroid isomerase-like protein
MEVVRQFWQPMASNDFHSVGAVLAEEFVLEWPQSNERARGKERFARMNAEYPSNGRWSFTVSRLVGGETEAVSEVEVTDGVQYGKAISFFTVANGKITRLVPNTGRSLSRQRRIGSTSWSPSSERAAQNG